MKLTTKTKFVIGGAALLSAFATYALPAGQAYHIEYMNGATRDYNCVTMTVVGNPVGATKSVTYGQYCNKPAPSAQAALN